MKALLLLHIALAGPSGAEEVPGQARMDQDWSFVSVKNLPVGTAGGWVDQKSVIIDHKGFCWLKADAQVRSSPEKAGGYLQVQRDAKGLILTAHQRYEWEATPQGDISEAVLPVMKWQKKLPKLAEPPAPSLSQKNPI